MMHWEVQAPFYAAAVAESIRMYIAAQIVKVVFTAIYFASKIFLTRISLTLKYETRRKNPSVVGEITKVEVAREV
jgi:hypothetical protein